MFAHGTTTNGKRDLLKSIKSLSKHIHGKDLAEVVGNIRRKTIQKKVMATMKPYLPIRGVESRQQNIESYSNTNQT
jgi:hypothetical protein